MGFFFISFNFKKGQAKFENNDNNNIFIMMMRII